VSGDLRAWGKEKNPGVSLRQSVRDAVGCGAMIHVEEDGSSLQTLFGRLRVPITRRDALARKIVGPSLVRASRHDNSFGFDREYGVHVRRLTGFDLHAGFARLPLQPTDQTMIFAAARQTDLPIQFPSKPR